VRPLIGITTYAEPLASWGHWTLPAALIPLAYVRAVDRAGGRPLLVPPSENGVAETLDVLDGIVFSGGSDVDPNTYGEDPHAETGDLRPERDEAELELMKAALERDLPLLAICRGSQLLNVARDGDLVQHLPEVVGDHKHKVSPGLFAAHDVAIDPGSRLGSLIGSEARVESHHHQGFGRIGEGLDVAAYAEDGSVEAVEDRGRRFTVGVLWHPEEGEDLRLFEALVEQASDYREARGG
jgi:gamma-glutamyl-gamma-aminobutyrate hydrolase PuuD